MFRLLITLFILALVAYYVVCLLQYMKFCQWTENEITAKMWIPFYYFFKGEPKPIEEKPVTVLDSVDPTAETITSKPRKRTKKVTNDE